MLQEIALEEFSHLEMVGKLIAQHTQKMDQTDVYAAPLFAMKGMGPHFIDSRGQAWTAAYINEGGNVVRDLRANIAAEAGARQTYEALINRCKDPGTKAVLTHLADPRNNACPDVHEGVGCHGQIETIRYFGNIATRRNRECGFQSLTGRGLSADPGTKVSSTMCPILNPKADFRPRPVNPDDEKIHRHAAE